jgi:hypothetical protein
VQRWLVLAAIDCLPGDVRALLGLAGPAWTLGPRRHALLRRCARAADRLVLATHPGVEACRRLGLAGDALQRIGDGAC